MSAWWERLGDGGGDKPAPAPTSVYEQRGLVEADDGDHWVTIAEADPRGPLRWLTGWESRAQGWTRLGEVLRGRDRW